MEYIFIVNNHAGNRKVKDFIDRELEPFELKVKYKVYTTKIEKDATKFVQKYSSENPDKEVCFIACGGDGTLSEVASGIVGTKNKYLAVMALGSGNDFVKYYPNKNFKSVEKLLLGKSEKIDILKVTSGDNISYSVNMINCGFEAKVASVANDVKNNGGKNPYLSGVVAAILHGRNNRFEISVDGEKIKKDRILISNFANSKYAGGSYMCSPNAENNDGLIDVIVFYKMTLLKFLFSMKNYKNGKHLSQKSLKNKLFYKRAKHIEISSKKQIPLCLDGEIITGTHFDIDILPNEINFIVPENK